MKHMGVSKNRDTPKWIVYRKPIRMEDLGGTAIFGKTHIWLSNWESFPTKYLGETNLNQGKYLVNPEKFW